MLDVIATQDVKPQCVLLRFWHLNQAIQYFEITNCVRKTHWEGASNKKSIRWMFCLRARVNDASDYQWGVRLSTGKNLRRRQHDNWGGAHIHIFVFCIINFFWNRLFLRYRWTRIYEYCPPPPPSIELAAPLDSATAELNGINYIFVCACQLMHITVFAFYYAFHWYVHSEFFLASERRSTQAWLQNLAPFQVWIFRS